MLPAKQEAQASCQASAPWQKYASDYTQNRLSLGQNTRNMRLPKAAIAYSCPNLRFHFKRTAVVVAGKKF
jgi:hypothetical protein